MSLKKILLACFLCLTLGLSAQDAEKQAIIKTIETMFDGMRESDTTKLLSVLHENTSLKTVYMDRSGNPRIHVGSMKDLAKNVAKPHKEVYDEKIWSYEIEIDGLMATAWTEYTFYLDDKVLHCGVNAFQLFKGNTGWTIVGIMDTRRKENCQTEANDHEQSINDLMDAWHKAAATADEDVFFEGTMTDDGIYLGTDASERWLRDELKTWSKKYFDRDTAWSFTAKSRNIYFSNDGKTAWFEEMLDTWMGDCRGSGVLEWTTKGWKLKHYDLSIMVPNDKVEGYLELIGVEKKR